MLIVKRSYYRMVGNVQSVLLFQEFLYPSSYYTLDPATYSSYNSPGRFVLLF